ncbi:MULTISPECIES: 7TM diverse intracellular signaling domain-containing protein [Pseudoalteromonas]|uniref:7TM diverse intracellular signaling domain-containing protein n=1 Tax=Pseudoalteromonas TaxID=53246 RepID=UPI000C56C9E8|nr:MULTISPECIES: 7TM diverse intracellular signaling domain-containing protein [Pseudoalteromonas]MAY60338.1 histidine kinase [Pseudoalteromonas sp.]MDN3407446.1 7TM diverse intracellular signaling domain-containing protein [Pseudoalteromonas sp. APC 3894]MDN3414757.1 7TM diverse intracellular signaling domain-containing protein [Pseudoalteromonas sp. APC 3227]MDN3418455.1 7TM diverse intracellular signaling domain-containing protein [Pseudoalteromonas sp. APC 3895]MDN3422152.1 7TM diverse int|tara:strand:- start:30199 stop:32883 length:2685 start_codon:yes stop_codon:yes gene_type:complete
MPIKAALKLFIYCVFICFSNLAVANALEPFAYTLKQQDTDLLNQGSVFQVTDGAFPRDHSDIETWLEKKQPQSRTSFFGGSFWFVIKLENKTDLNELVLYPYNTLLSKIETRIYDMSNFDEPINRYTTGGIYPNEFAFHYGNRIELTPTRPYMLIAKFQSEYFYTPPKLVLSPYDDFFVKKTSDNMIMLLCFGVGIALGLYNFLIYLGDRDKTHLYYALFTACWVLAWSQFFHIPDQIFGFYNAHFHWLGFTLIPITNILFFNSLLKLKETSPQLSRLSIYLGIIATAGTPFAIIWPGFGFIWATLVTGATLCLGMIVGIRSWLSGFKPARYFVLAYLAMAIPNMVGNLTNLGLIEPIKMDLYLLGLIGTALDAVLLAFAVANKFSILHHENVELTKNLEHKVQLRTQELQQLAEELRDASEAKSRFLANMSHEIRTPMTSIIGYADGIILGDIQPHERNHGIRVILQNSRHVLGLINDILDMSKIEANRLEIELVETDLFATIAEIESLLGKQIRDKGLKFKVDYQFPLPDWIVSDPTRLRQILLNLATNALKFTSQGYIKLTVSCNKKQLIIKVKDTGIGMTDSEQKDLFTPFHQADSSISRKYGGTGLGLNISKSLATKLDGDITVYSMLGSGSEFCFTMALHTTAHTKWVNAFDDICKSQNKELPINSNQRNLIGRVLVAEDHPENRQLIKRILERMGLTVVTVENGRDAAQATLDEQFDLILLDIQMPIMDGEQAISIMQATGVTTPIVALTANTMKHEVDRYLRQGFTDHIAKPIDRRCFSSKIASYLDIDICENIKLPDDEFALLKQEYIKGLKKQKHTLQLQFKQGDITGFARSVHMIKGTAGMFECQVLYQQAVGLEASLKLSPAVLDTHQVEALLNAIDVILEA